MQMVETGQVQREPTTDAVILRRLDDTVAAIPAGNFAARVVLGDVTYPRTPEELRGVGGFALLLVTAVSHDEAELPIHRVEVKIGDKVVPLPSLKSRRTTLGGRRAEILGAYRVDEIFPLPVFMTQKEAIVTAYLGGGRYPLEILQFPSSVPPPGLDLKIEPGVPGADALRKLIDEELPVIGSAGLVQ